MKRDWDKLKRQDRAKSSYDPISSFVPKVGKRFKKHRPRVSLKPTPKQIPPDVERVLIIKDSLTTSMSHWRRIKGRWLCIATDPGFEWFRGIRNIDVLHDWLMAKHFSYQWQRATPVCTAHKQTEDNPAESYPLNKASALSKVNTVPSLNNPSPDSVPAKVLGHESGLARTGIANPCRLIPSTNTDPSC